MSLSNQLVDFVCLPFGEHPLNARLKYTRLGHNLSVLGYTIIANLLVIIATFTFLATLE